MPKTVNSSRAYNNKMDVKLGKHDLRNASWVEEEKSKLSRS